MGEHLVEVDGALTFKSDKYEWCPPGFVPLKLTDPMAQPELWRYAQTRRAVDAIFANDLETALRASGYEPPKTAPCVRCGGGKRLCECQAAGRFIFEMHTNGCDAIPRVPCPVCMAGKPDTAPMMGWNWVCGTCLGDESTKTIGVIACPGHCQCCSAVMTRETARPVAAAQLERIRQRVLGPRGAQPGFVPRTLSGLAPWTTREPDHLGDALKGLTVAREAKVLGASGTLLADAIEHVIAHLELPAGAREKPVGYVHNHHTEVHNHADPGYGRDQSALVLRVETSGVARTLVVARPSGTRVLHLPILETQGFSWVADPDGELRIGDVHLLRIGVAGPKADAATVERVRNPARLPEELPIHTTGTDGSVARSRPPRATMDVVMRTRRIVDLAEELREVTGQEVSVVWQSDPELEDYGRLIRIEAR